MSTASLPMYDWPEVQPAVDRFWTLLHVEFQARGFNPPETIDRQSSEMSVWTDPDLLISHTCGLPLMTALSGQVAVVGSFDMDLPDTPAGDYHSAIVVRVDDSRPTLADFAGAPVAINSRDSQSGHAALAQEIAPEAADGRFFGSILQTGGHRASMQAVASGRADIAAIDAASFRLGQRHDPAVAALRVLHRTDPRPGLPLITSPARTAEAPIIADAVEAAIRRLSSDDRNATGMHGLVRRTTGDYQVLLDDLNNASRQGYPEVA